MLRARSLLCVLCIGFAAAIAPAAAQKLPPGMTMHRIQAGEPDASGWVAAASSEGGFSVRMPLKFNDFTLQEPDPAAAALRTYTVGARSSEGIKFSATRIVYRSGAESARRFFANFEQGQGLGAKPERVTPLSFAGRRAVDIVLRNGTTVAYERAVLLDADLVLLVLESPRAYDDAAAKLAAPFLDSLLIQRR